jgi:hypothetical protein
VQPDDDRTEALLGKLVRVESGATAEELEAIYRFAMRECEVRSGECGVQGAEGRGRSAELRPAPAGGDRKPPYVFRWTGRDWEVVFGGDRAFHLPDTLGARYLHYLLHRPNVPVSAFDLEVAIQPEKAAARSRTSIQAESDARAKREYREALKQLRRAECGMRNTEGGAEEAERLKGEIKALESALQGGTAPADTGERAFDNVRKALRVALDQLRKGAVEERAFAEHLRTHLNIGFECLYSEAEILWSEV